MSDRGIEKSWSTRACVCTEAGADVADVPEAARVP